MRTIVTHLNPDLDAICSVWLLKRFCGGWEEAQVKFVPAGITPANGKRSTAYGVESETLYVDTGYGELDHHQTGARTCASKLVWEYILKNSKLASRKRTCSEQAIRNSKLEREAIDRLVDVVLRIDFDAEDITIPNAADDFYSFLFNERQIIRGIRSLYRGQSEKHLEIGFVIYDAIYEVLKAKIKAEEVIAQGIEFHTKWGKGLGAITNNEMYLHLAQEKGYRLVVAKDPKRGHIRIHALPNRKIDFTDAYNKLSKLDASATWFLHASKSLLLNGSSANPDMKPTKLTLEEIIEVLKEF